MLKKTSMSNVILIHGAYGDPNENWFPWLKNELEKIGHNVYIPKFPTPEKQSLENWMNAFSQYQKFLNENSIVIGHSIGVAFLLRVLEKMEIPIKSAYFVSGFISTLGNPEFDIINQSFFEKNYDWEKIKKNCHNFHLFHSDNDPYVPLAKGNEIAKSLSIPITLIKNAGHFNTKSGYTKFTELLELLA